MIEQKGHDWILNILSNPTFSTADFKNAGLDAENTSLLSEQDYLKSQKILENPQFAGEDQKFDKNKFHNFYQGATTMYNMLANETYLDKLEKEQVIYGKDDIFAPRKQRRTFVDTVQYSRSHNPNRQTTGLVRIGETANPKFSDEEIAQTQKVLVNPVEADKDPSKAIWHDAPNDSWFTDFWDTRVLAQWEDDGTHIDSITGEEVSHKKGELKLNDNGTYYYENLDGRDVYGKRVLNKMNTLTTDDSKWNKYDFFDSDDLEQKSIGGTVMKNLALVGTMFVPYVGPVVAGLSVASQLAGLTGTLGKMLLGSDSPTFSALEGWAKSVNRQTAKSIYAQQNTWCWENFISLIGDVAGQLKEQRFLFNYAPAIIKGNKVLGANGISQSKQAKLVEETANKYRQQYTSTLEKLNQAGKTDATTFRQFQDAMTSAKIVGQNEVEDFMKSYYKIGEILSKGYMTAITVGDTYGEAKYEGGASDIEATLLTLGYGAAELALLNSNIGEWILPELKNSGLKNKKIVEALKTGIPEEMREQAIDKSSRAAKENFVKFWFNKGKELANDINIAGKGLVGQGISGGLGEGFEEVSEELLADVAKSCYNIVQWMQGDSGRMSTWDNMLDRYGMSFIGGAIGGGLTAIGTNFNTYNKDLTTEQAMQELVYMSREGKLDEIYKTLDKVTIGNKYLQGEFNQQDGELKLKPATSTSSNLDKDIKNTIRSQIQIIDDIVKTEGLKFTDNQFISAQTFNDIKLAYLAQSPVTSSYLQDFNSLCTKIINIKNQMNQLKSTDAKLTDEQQQVYDNLNSELNDLRKQKNKYINGDYAMDYVGKSLLSMSPVFSQFFTKGFFKDYVEVKEKKKFDQVSDSRLKELKTEFDNWKATEFKDCISVMAPMYQNLARNFGQYAIDFATHYDKNRNNESLLKLIRGTLQKQTDTLLTVDENNMIQDPDQDAWVEQLQKSLSSTYADTAIALLLSKGSDSTKQTLQSLTQAMQNLNSSSPTYEQDLQKAKQDQADFIVNELLNNSHYYFSDIISAGLINPEIKQSVVSTIDELKKIQKNYEDIMSSSYKTLPEIEDDFLMYGLSATIDQNTKIEDLINTHGQDIVNDIINTQSLSQIASSLGMEFKTLGDIETINQELKNRGNSLDQTKSGIASTTYTNITKFIQDFIQSNSDSNLNIVQLLDSINTLLTENKDNLSSVNLEQFGQQIDEAIEVIGWLQGVTLGAQYDAEASLSNLMGYNQAMNTIAKRHGVKDWDDLFTINQDTANIINQDLTLIKNKLIQAKNLKYINEGKKLSLQDRVATNKKYIEYNRLARWIINIDDSWLKKSELQNAISKAETLKKYAADRKNITLSQEENLKAEQEALEIDKAIYSFFEANSDKVKNGELKNLFKKDFNFWDTTTQILNESTEYLSDRNFFWYLASRAAIDRGSFLKNFKPIIEPTIAPLPTQEEAIFINIANALNGDTMSSFKNAYIQAAQEEYDNSNSKEDIIRKFKPGVSQNVIDSILQEKTIKGLEIIPQYDITLTEGIPGAGKSAAVNYYTIKMLQGIKELSKNIVYVHNNIQGAEKAIKSLGINAKASDKNSFMRSIFSAYNIARSVDSEGNSLYDKDEFITTQDGQIITKYNIDSLTNPPSLLIIDEVSHYDEPDLQLIQKLIDNYGTVVITSGDYDQSSKKAVVRNWDSTSDLILSSFNHQFISPIKLGVSMRSANAQLDKTLSDYQAWLQLEESKRGQHTFYWYEDSNGINGAKIINQNDSEIISNVQKMIDTLQEENGVKQKIGLIYYDENSPVYKLLTSRFGDNIQTFKGNAAQGFEGQYYIIDTNNIPATFQKDLYTGVSRSSQGVLIIGNVSNINSVQETATTQKKYSPQELEKYTKKRIELIDKLDTGNADLVYKPRTLNTNNSRSQQQNVLPPDVPVVEPPSSINWNGPAFIYYLNGVKYYTDGTIVASDINGSITEIQNTDPIYQQIIDLFNDDSLVQEPIQNDTLNPLQNAVEINNADNNQPNTEPPIQDEGTDFKFSYLFHSFNTFELGVENNNGKVKWLGPIERYTHRFDSVIGLLKIFEGSNWYSSHDIQKYIDILGTLRGALFTLETKSEIANAIEYILQEAGVKVESIEFGLVSSPNISKKNRNNGQKWGYANATGKYGALDKSTEETSINGTSSNEINRKSLNAVIRFQGGKKLAIPLFVLGNLETYTRNPQNSVSQRLAQLHTQSNGNYHQFIQSILNDSMLQNVPEVYNLAKLFNFTGAGYFKIDDDTWTPARNLNNWGIQVNVEANSGGHFPYNGREQFNPIKSFLAANPGMKFSKQIYTSFAIIRDQHGNSINIARNGHPFILATYDSSKISDEQMMEQYKLQLIDPSLPKTVSLIYIAPPKVGIDQYLTNLYKIIKKADGTKVLGSHLTSYQCWKALLPILQDNTSWLYSTLSEKVREYIINKVQEIDNARDKVNAVMTDDEVQNDQRVPGQAQKQSVLKHLNYLLVHTFKDLGGNIIPENLNKLTQSLANAGQKDIFYSPKFLNKEIQANQEFIPIIQNAPGTYTIDGLDFTINAKIDSNLFQSNNEFNDIVENWVNKIDESGSVPRSSDTDLYVGSSTTNNAPTNEYEFSDSFGNTHKFILQDDGTITYNGRKVRSEIQWNNLIRGNAFYNIKQISDYLKSLTGLNLHQQAKDIYIKQFQDCLYDNNQTVDELIVDEVFTQVDKLNNTNNINTLYYIVPANNKFGIRILSTTFDSNQLSNLGINLTDVIDRSLLQQIFEQYNRVPILHIQLSNTHTLQIDTSTNKSKIVQEGSSGISETPGYIAGSNRIEGESFDDISSGTSGDMAIYNELNRISPTVAQMYSDLIFETSLSSLKGNVGLLSELKQIKDSSTLINDLYKYLNTSSTEKYTDENLEEENQYKKGDFKINNIDFENIMFDSEQFNVLYNTIKEKSSEAAEIFKNEFKEINEEGGNLSDLKGLNELLDQLEQIEDKDILLDDLYEYLKEDDNSCPISANSR